MNIDGVPGGKSIDLPQYKADRAVIGKIAARSALRWQHKNPETPREKTTKQIVGISLCGKEKDLSLKTGHIGLSRRHKTCKNRLIFQFSYGPMTFLVKIEIAIDRYL